ncbi:hypothetical protein K7I13_11765 [Brucepastera parasyntrophica]|uniref:hypothetical protein n=1 Tax=Brucepastera parasyntrophica TaxID=2880008 RepID=UPI00210F012C|nr:hypothetical protein [Brucepastera parasyntrophica]ULQ59166.1 hypothetical protein K7I13_11765 [Brucepastera parasyntrophica]
MKKKMTVIVAVMFLCFGSVFALDLDFTLINGTGVDIYEVYVSPVESDDWGDDILEDDILFDEEDMLITFGDQHTSRYWDILCIDEDYDEYYLEEIDLTEVSLIIVVWEDGPAFYYE